MPIRSFAEVHAALNRFVPPERSQRAAYTLERMRQLMHLLGDPQNSYKTVHIAGTSGKTSVAYYTAALLGQTGAKVGLTVSPHIDEVNERLQINLHPLGEKRYCQAFSTFLNLVKSLPVEPTYFELLVAFAYWQFAREKVEYAVVEVGLGGLLDGTNVINRQDKVCVITDIGIDHANVLGNTIPQITAQKAGIIKPHTIVFSLKQTAQIMNVIREVAGNQQAELHEVLLKKEALPENLPLFQRRNWYLATSVVDYVLRRDNFPSLRDDQLYATTQTYIPARMEIIRRHGKILVLDGAHNPQKMKALVASLKDRFPNQTFAVLLGLVRGKNLRIKHVLKELLPVTETLIVTSFETEQDMRKFSSSPRRIAAYATELGFQAIEVIERPSDAYGVLLNSQASQLLVTGSFYLLNHIRPLVFKEKKRD